MALVKLGTKAVESIVKLKENGTPVNYIVVHQGLPGTMYDASCDGTWLLGEDVCENGIWKNYKSNDYANSDVHAYLNSIFLGRFDADIQAAIKQVKIPYRPGKGSSTTVNSGANGLYCKAFSLSCMEIGWKQIVTRVKDGEKLDYFEKSDSSSQKLIANFNGSPVEWGLRSPVCDSYYDPPIPFSVSKSGSSLNGVGTTAGVRPAMILPKDLWVSDDGTVITNTAPTTPSSLTVPSQINGGSTVTVEWGASSDSENNLEGYILERSLDGGSSWTQIYQGGARSTTNTVPFGTESVMYRVKAYDSEGLASGWRASAQIAVINNTAPTVPGSITVPEKPQGGQPLTISWGASTDGENNLAGYSLERQVDGGGWSVAYSGPELSFTDAITKGWQTVAYRVRAYDTANAYSGFAASETRAVNNNTPPAILCGQPSGSSLGTQNEGFSLAYTVEDEEGDEVTVTEAVDGAAWHTFTVELGAANRFQLGGVDFMKLLNGRHGVTITAADSASSSVHSLSFIKEVTSASVTLEQPMQADGPISVCVLSVSGSIPLDADFRVLATNNALDDEPVWEDCTAAVRSGANYIFDNGAAANGFAFNFRLSVERGPSGLGGHITSVQGGFQ